MKLFFLVIFALTSCTIVHGLPNLLDLIRQIAMQGASHAMDNNGKIGSPWTVFQRRMDGTVNFTRGWTDYVDGFGDKHGDFWLGLDELHQLTNDGHFELRIDMTDINGDHWYASYSTFKVGPATEYYKLTATGYSGDATDSLGNGAIPNRIHNRQRFSTHDSDNDNWYRGSCAAKYGAGWWYDNCYDSNLNGAYNDQSLRGIVWVNQTARTNIFLKFVEMKFRMNDDGHNDDIDDAPTCSDVVPESATTQDETGGVFELDILQPAIGRKEVYCDLTTDGGNWIVFQRRMDGSVDFSRNWIDYVNGFGDVTKEFWLGLETIYQLTKSGQYELRIDMIARDGTSFYANYNTFKVGPASEFYKLTATGYSGNATDSLGNGAIPGRIHSGQGFSTRDSDNDNWLKGSCAAKYGAGWWYDDCYDSHLNGAYNDLSLRGIVWVNQTARSDIFLKFVEMKFRRNDDGHNDDFGNSPTCPDEVSELTTTQYETGGVFELYIPPWIRRTEVYCDLTTDGGDWIVFQRRKDGSVDFNRNWIDYVNGFGDVTKEFWLGLEPIYQLTKSGDHELRIDMIERDGTHFYAKYDHFKIGPSSDKYRLTVGGYSGNASDSFAHPPDPWSVLDNQQFSTKDVDNDLWKSGSCAVKYTGAWWFKDCMSSNLNGVYNVTTDWSGIAWFDYEKRGSFWRRHMRFTEMKFRRKD